jgi:hypothetical protein
MALQRLSRRPQGFLVSLKNIRSTIFRSRAPNRKLKVTGSSFNFGRNFLQICLFLSNPANVPQKTKSISVKYCLSNKEIDNLPVEHKNFCFGIRPGTTAEQDFVLNVFSRALL